LKPSACLAENAVLITKTDQLNAVREIYYSVFVIMKPHAHVHPVGKMQIKLSGAYSNHCDLKG
jgi:hypothetical protein